MTPNPGETTVHEGTSGVKVIVHWGEDGGTHEVFFEWPEGTSEEWREGYRDTFTMCLLEQGVDLFG
jgi:hypothetical protein